MKTLYAVTHIGRDGFRVLTRPNQGRNHFLLEADCEAWIEAALKHNSRDTLLSVFGPHLDTFEASPVECYDHGDAFKLISSYHPERDLVSTDQDKQALARIFRESAST